MSNCNYDEGYEGVKQSAQTEDDKGLSLDVVLGGGLPQEVIPKRRLEEGGGARHAKMLQEVFQAKGTVCTRAGVG